jgi:hypothetical protein
MLILPLDESSKIIPRHRRASIGGAKENPDLMSGFSFDFIVIFNAAEP